MFKWMKTRLNSLLRRERLEQDLDRELSFHIDMLTEQNIRAGMVPGEARAQAVRRFGRVEGVKDAVRDTWLSVCSRRSVRTCATGCEPSPQPLLRSRRGRDGPSGSARIPRSSVSSTASSFGRSRTKEATVSSSCGSSVRSPAIPISVSRRRKSPITEHRRPASRASPSSTACGSFCSAAPSLSACRPVSSPQISSAARGQAHARPVVHSRGRAGRLAGSADPQPQVLAAQLRRRPVDRRAGLPDERSAA